MSDIIAGSFIFIAWFVFACAYFAFRLANNPEKQTSALHSFVESVMLMPLTLVSIVIGPIVLFIHNLRK